MLIVSKFHDYYDSAVAYGVDKSVVYKRETRQTEDSKRWSPENKLHGKKRVWQVEEFVVGFCGKIYPAIKLVEDSPSVIVETKCFYDLDSLNKFLEDEGVNVTANKSWRSNWGRYSRYYISNASDRKKWFDINHHADKKFDAVFMKKKCPMFIYNHKGMIYNPRLKDVNFQKIMDSYTAFQEIYMYISGVLGTNENDMVNISDRDMLKKKGFDKWSFKKLPKK